MSGSSDNKRSKPGITLLLVFSVCFMPVAGAWLIYHFTDFWKDGGESDHRHLLDPPLLIADVGLAGYRTGDHEHRLHGKWSLLYLPAKGCKQICEQRLETMHQLRLATGKEAFRIRVVLATHGPHIDRELEERLQKFRGRLFFLTENQETEGAFDLLHSLDAEEEAFYLIDPLGNLIVRFPFAADHAAITRDLKRLLRYSRVG